MKRMVALFGMMLASCAAMAATQIVDGIEWTYTVSGDKASVGGGSWSSTAVPTSTTGAISIPSTLGGYPVTSIGSGAFAFCDGLTSATIPSSVTSIGKSAFYGCSGLTSVTMSEGVTSIGNSAFHGCSGLTSVTIPSSVTNIGAYAFRYCSGLTNVVFGGNAPTCGANVFDNVKSGCTATVKWGTTGWDDDGNGKWQGLTLVWRDAPKPDGGPCTEAVGIIK